jgi:hypothetical protein
MTDDRETEQGSALVPLLIAWAFVGVPLAWGVAQVVKRSLALFT